VFAQSADHQGDERICERSHDLRGELENPWWKPPLCVMPRPPEKTIPRHLVSMDSMLGLMARDTDGEDGARFSGRYDVDPAAVRRHDLAGDVQAQTDTAHAALPLRIY
jgi:hypothetical protein